MRLRALVPCVALLSLCACGTASDLVSAESSGRDGGPRTPTESPATSDPTTPPTPPTTQKTKNPKKQRPEKPPKRLPHVVGSIRFFASPTENIGCAISRSGVRCDIGEKSYREPRKPASCRLDYGQALRVGRADRIAEFLCAGDTVLGARRILRYHTSSVVGNFGCTSRESGMSCYNLETRHGFLISREVVDVF
jgi:hypothetical protein